MFCKDKVEIERGIDENGFEVIQRDIIKLAEKSKGETDEWEFIPKTVKKIHDYLKMKEE